MTASRSGPKSSGDESDRSNDASAHGADPDTIDPPPVLLRIGEVAERAAVSTRTIRYYEQVGLLAPSDRSPGATRRYTEPDLARLLRIRELQATMGFDLDQIRTILGAEDRLHALRDEYGEAIPLARRNDILLEAIDLNAQMQDQVHAKVDRLSDFLDDLGRKSVRYQQLAAERGLVRRDPD